MNYSYTSLTNTNRQMFLKTKLKIMKYISESHKDDKLSRIRDTSPKTTLPKRLFAEKTLGLKKS